MTNLMLDQGPNSPSVSHIIPTNGWAVKPSVQGRKEAAADLSSPVGRPRYLCMFKEPVPRRFYVQLDMDDMHMLVIPSAFQKVLKVFLKFRLPTSICLSACRSCEEWISVTELDGQIVLSRGWRCFARNHDLQYNDMLVFSLKNYGLQVKIYKAASSIMMPYFCPIHS